MKILRILIAGIAGMLFLALPVQATDAEKITEELFAELDAVADVGLMNDVVFESLRLAQAQVESVREEFELDRAEHGAEMALAREALEHAAREMARLGQEMAGDIAIRIHQRQPKAMLGINLGGGPATKHDNGVEVVGVSSGGPAEKASLEAGDILVKIDDVSLKADDEESSIGKLIAYMADVEPGQKVTVGYLRDGKSHSAVIETTEFKFFDMNFDFDFSGGENLAFAFSAPDGLPGHAPHIARKFFAFGGHRFGGALGDIEMVSLTEELGEYFGVKEGLLVVRAPKDENIDLRDGDVILKIGDRKPSSPGQAIRIIGSYEAGETVELQVMRNKKKRKLEITLPKIDRDIRIWKNSDDAIIHKLKIVPSTGT